MSNDSSAGALVFTWAVMSLLFGGAIAGRVLLNAAFRRWPFFHRICHVAAHAVCWVLAAGLWALLGAIIGFYLAALHHQNP